MIAVRLYQSEYWVVTFLYQSYITAGRMSKSEQLTIWRKSSVLQLYDSRQDVCLIVTSEP